MDSAPAAHRHWLVFGATSLGVLAVFISMSGLTVALPTLTRELDASPAQTTWIVLAYMVVTTALILIFGRLADIVGRRPLYLAGLVLFTIATVACAVSPSAGWLIAARVVQGIGAASVVTNNTALLTDVFPARVLGRGLGWNATVAALGQVIGPLVGGVATAAFGWSGLFIVVAPLAALACAVSFAVIPGSPRLAHRRESFDVLGAILATMVLTLLALALTPGMAGPSWLPWVYGTTAAVVAATMVGWLLRRTDPLIDLSLFRDRGISVILVAAFLAAVSTYAVPLVISLYEQAVAGTSPSAAGLLVTPLAVGTVLAASIAGGLVALIHPRTLTALGLALIAGGLVGTALCLTGQPQSHWPASLCLGLIGCGIGLFMTPSTSALMLTVHADRRGIANGLRSTLQNVGNLLSTALVLAIATIGLGVAAREAAYGGATAALADTEIDRLVDNLRIGGWALAALAVVGIAVCLCFPRATTATALLEPITIPDDAAAFDTATRPAPTKEPV